MMIIIARHKDLFAIYYIIIKIIIHRYYVKFNNRVIRKKKIWKISISE